jgi:methylated-DNA-[protein]-cysteine S-methyltransferase
LDSLQFALGHIQKMPVTEFQDKVYNLVKQIPEGRVTTYACLARELNTSPRAVGNALRNNPFAPTIPCHRCIASNGYISGYQGEKISRPVTKSKKSGRKDIRAAHKKPSSTTERPENILSRSNTRLEIIPPSGMKTRMKLDILKKEGIEFSDRGMIIDRMGKFHWDGPWN